MDVLLGLSIFLVFGLVMSIIAWKDDYQKHQKQKLSMQGLASI
jgi:hypothetical protein